MNLDDLRREERATLMESLRDLGPDAPTLCSAWRSADLAAHLVVSEAYRGWPMVVAYGARRVLPASITRRGMHSLEAVGDRLLRRTRSRGWDWLLDRVAAGPPTAYRRPPIALIRLIEEWVHHEDLRRANGMAVRSSSQELEDALWQAGLVLTGFPEFLPGRDGVEVALPDGRSRLLGGTARVRLEGEPGELLFFLAGRTGEARVTVAGDSQDIEALRLAV
jgi:uncharacterized protein (TIGR03085 family)